MTTETLWRLASMTKPVTSVAAMMLYEEGASEFGDPISKWLPAFADMQVYTSGSRCAWSPGRRPSPSGYGTCSPGLLA